MAGYSGTPLAKKLGIREGYTIFVLCPPDAYFDWMNPLPENLTVKQKLTGEFDLIHLFVKDYKDFQLEFRKAKKHLKPNGSLWISWPKKSSKVLTSLDENIIRNFGLKEGLVDVKVCAVDNTWSGLKFVFRLKDR